MVKKLICMFTDGKKTFTKTFIALTRMGALKKASAFQENTSFGCLSMAFA